MPANLDEAFGDSKIIKQKIYAIFTLKFVSIHIILIEGSRWNRNKVEGMLST